MFAAAFWMVMRLSNQKIQQYIIPRVILQHTVDTVRTSTV